MKIRYIWLTSIFILMSFLVALVQAQAFTDAEKLAEVEQLFHEGKYADLYQRFLGDIPAFNRFSKSTEQLYYFFALTCIELGYYDEAEGYLYTVRTKTDFPHYLETYDLIWAKLLDRRGHIFAAYRRYLFIRVLYPQSGAMPAILLRLSQLAQVLGKFEPGRRHAAYLFEHYPDSSEAQYLMETDDYKLTGYMIVFGMFRNDDDAKLCVTQLEEKEISAFIFRTFYRNQRVFLVCSGFYDDKTLAGAERAKLRREGFGVVIYPPFPQETGLSYFDRQKSASEENNKDLFRHASADNDKLTFHYTQDALPQPEVSNNLGALPPPTVQTGKQDFTFGITRRVKF